MAGSLSPIVCISSLPQGPGSRAKCTTVQAGRQAAWDHSRTFFLCKRENWGWFSACGVRTYVTNEEQSLHIRGSAPGARSGVELVEAGRIVPEDGSLDLGREGGMAEEGFHGVGELAVGVGIVGGPDQDFGADVLDHRA